MRIVLLPAMKSFQYPPLTIPESVHLFNWKVGDGILDHGMKLAAAIGNFDGVHLGHRRLIEAAGEAGGMTPAVVTFTPHPRRFFKPGDEGFLLADQQDKNAMLADAGAEVVVDLRFDDALRNTTASDFIREVLPSLGVGTLCAGEDFVFGNDRQGSLGMVATEGATSGIVAHPVGILEDGGGPVSSSRIREALSVGRVEEAGRLLGRPYIISGAVEEGDRRGRELGFPTANIALGEMLQPAYGVYSVAVRLADQPEAPVHAGVANLGRRPSVNDRGVLLEANIIDYDGNLYGQRLNVMLLDFIRPEETFDGLDALKEQIGRDANTAKAFHARTTGLVAT